MVGALLLATAVAAQPAQPETQPAPAEFEASCLLVGPEGREDRFVLIAAGNGDGRRFAFRGDSAPAWAAQVSAGSVRGPNSFHFVSNGQAYRLDLQFDRPNGSALTAKAGLYEDRGDNALNLQVAGGSCRSVARNATAALPALPPAPAVRPVGYATRVIGLRNSRVPSDCIIVLRDLRTIQFGLDVGIDGPGVQLTVSPQAGQSWPAQAFTLRGASLVAQVSPLSGGARFMNVIASAGNDPASSAPAALTYDLRADQSQMAGWLQVKMHGSPETVGAGFCGVRESPGQQTDSRQ